MAWRRLGRCDEQDDSAVVLAAAHAAGAALGSIAGVAFGWDLVTNANATVGGVNLAVVGSGATFDADGPTFGGGGGGNVIVASSLFRRETARDHAKRLDISGWRGVMDLRRAA